MSSIRTARSVEHPRRNFEPAIRPRIAQCAAENRTIRFVDHLVDRNPHPEPWMPGINKHSENDGPVGVLELRSTIASDRIRALPPGRRIAPTSTACHCSRQHEFRRRCRGITPVGLRPPCATPRQRHTIMSTGRGSTYRGRNAVSTKPATSSQRPGRWLLSAVVCTAVAFGIAYGHHFWDLNRWVTACRV